MQLVHRRKSIDITELKQDLSTEDLADIPTRCCAGLISSYKEKKKTESKDSHTSATHRYATLVNFLN